MSHIEDMTSQEDIKDGLDLSYTAPSPAALPPPPVNTPSSLENEPFASEDLDDTDQHSVASYDSEESGAAADWNVEQMETHEGGALNGEYVQKVHLDLILSTSMQVKDIGGS